MTRTLIIFALCFLIFSCRENHSKIKKITSQENTKQILINFSNGWKFKMNVPKRYDTQTTWKDSRTCEDGLCRTRYRFQSSSQKLFTERGIEFYGDPKIDSLFLPLFLDSIDRLTILAPSYFVNDRTSGLKNKNEIYKDHQTKKEEYLRKNKIYPSTDIKLIEDTVLEINFNYYSLFAFAGTDSLHKTIYKEIRATTIINGNEIIILNQLATKNNNERCYDFIDNSKKIIRSIKISYGI